MISPGYVPVSTGRQYMELNRQFVRSLVPYLGEYHSFLDLACGAATWTELLLAERQSEPVDGFPGAGQRVFALDISREALGQARRRFAARGKAVGAWNGRNSNGEKDRAIIFVQASGDNVPLAERAVGVVLIGNAIHCFSDKSRVFDEVYRVLEPGGVFAFNTAFYAGTMVEGTQAFYLEWIKKALDELKRQAVQAPGGGPVLQKRGQGKPAFSNRWLSPFEYSETLQARGFTLISLRERTVMMSSEDFASMISDTGNWESELASVLLSGYPTELASKALAHAVQPVMARFGAERIPRAWLELICRKHD